MPVAFSHDDLPLKQQFLKMAREFNLNAGTVENELAAALLYMNLADYLAEYLVTGMNQLTREAVSKYYLGVMAYIPQQKDSFNIGNAIYALKGFEFPKKAQIMGVLDVINNSRKKIAHEIVKTKGDDLLTIDEAVRRLIEHTEQLVVLVDEVDNNLPPTNLGEQLQANMVEAEPIKKTKPTKKVKK